jgi:hypothetical protein
MDGITAAQPTSLTGVPCICCGGLGTGFSARVCGEEADDKKVCEPCAEVRPFAEGLALLHGQRSRLPGGVGQWSGPACAPLEH